MVDPHPVGRWGAPAEPVLSDAVKALLASALELDPEARTAPQPVRPTPSRLDAEAFAATGAEVITDDPVRLAFAAGSAYADLVRVRAGGEVPAPDAVVRPVSHEQVAAVLRAAGEHGVAVVPWGGGTSVVGGVAPLRGAHAAAVALDLRALGGLLALDPVSRVARFGAGTTGPEADALLHPYGLTLGHVPQSYARATLGGYAVTRSAGQASTGFGRFDDLVERLRVATPAGELALGRAPGSAAGPDLRALILGSEGTLGVVTELELRVRALPERTLHEGFLVPSFAAGIELLRRLEQDGAAPDIARLSDEVETALGVATGGGGGGHEGGCLAILGWEGAAAAVTARRAAVEPALLAAGTRALGEEAGRHWHAGRFRAPYLRDELLGLGVLAETLETATRWSALEDLHDAVVQAVQVALPGARPLVACHVSHLYPAGASLYFTVIARADRADPAGQWHAAKRAAGDAIAAAGATITHHHAVGTDHSRWLAAEIGELGVDLLRTVKARLDPAGILNPGKLLP